jgi:hypothetical protein
MSAYDPIDLRSQDRARNAEAVKQRLAADLESADLLWLMTAKRGRRFMWRLLEVSGVTRISFNPNALQMAFNEGERNFGNKVLAWILAECPDRYLEMLKEHTKPRVTNDDRSDGSGDNTN